MKKLLGVFFLVLVLIIASFAVFGGMYITGIGTVIVVSLTLLILAGICA